jgi:FlaA1/EpsC-like NDP-sugar epimerase
VTFIPLGLYAGVWRYASTRDALRAVAAVVVSEIAAVGVIVITQGDLGDFSRSVFVIDAFICSMAIVAARFAERAIAGTFGLARRGDMHRVVIVGAGRAGRSLLRELRETPGERVVAFVDDDPGLSGRRLNGVRVAGGIDRLSGVIEQATPETVLVTIPNAPRDRLDEIVRVCAQRDVACRFVLREIAADPQSLLHTNGS